MKVQVTSHGKVIGTMTTTEFMAYAKEHLGIGRKAFLPEYIDAFNAYKEKKHEPERVRLATQVRGTRVNHALRAMMTYHAEMVESSTKHAKTDPFPRIGRKLKAKVDAINEVIDGLKEDLDEQISARDVILHAWKMHDMDTLHNLKAISLEDRNDYYEFHFEE